MEQRRTLSIGITVNLGNYENLHLEVSDAVETKEDAAGLRRFLAEVLNDFAANNATAKQAIDKYKERILDDDESSMSARAESVHDEYCSESTLMFHEHDVSAAAWSYSDSAAVSIPIPPAAEVNEPEREIPFINLTAETGNTESDESETPEYEVKTSETCERNEDETENVTENEAENETENEPAANPNTEKEITDAINALENKPVVPESPKPEEKPQQTPTANPHGEIKPPVTQASSEFTCAKCGVPITRVQAQVSKLFSGKNLCQDCFNGTKK